MSEIFLFVGLPILGFVMGVFITLFVKNIRYKLRNLDFKRY